MKKTHVVCASMVLYTSFLVYIAYCAHVLFIPQRFFIKGDYRLKEQASLCIENLIKHNYAQLSYQEHHELLHKQAPFIDSVSAQLRPHQTVVVSYKIQEPIAVLTLAQQKFILTINGVLIDTDVIDTSVQEHLLSIKLEQHLDQSHLQELALWIKDLPLEIIEQFAISWINATEIVLKPQAYQSYECLITAQTPLDQSFRTALARIITELSARDRAQKKIRPWIIDMRFKQNIPVRRRNA